MATFNRVLLTLILIASFALNSTAQNIISSFDNFTLRNNLPSDYGPETCNDCTRGVIWDTGEYEEWVWWSRDERYSETTPWHVKEKMNFRVVFPEGYDPTNADKYPLIVHLSGCGETGRVVCGGGPVEPERYDNNVTQLGWTERWAGYNHLQAVKEGEWPGIVIFPQADYQGWESGWYNSTSPTMSVLFDLIENFIPEFNVDPHEVIIHGFSNGGKGVWDAINRRPDLFAAALPMSAVAPNEFFGQAGHMPIWHFQGEVDSNPVADAARGLNAFYEENGGNHRYTEYPGRGHGIWFEPYAYAEPDFFSWMAQQSQLNIHSFYGYTDLIEASGEITLGIAPGHQDYEWYRNGAQLFDESGHQLVVNDPGDYVVRWQRYDGVWCTSNVFSISGVAINLPPTALVNDICTSESSQTLFAVSNDPEGEALTYSWSAMAPTGYQGVFSNEAIEQPALTLALDAGVLQVGPVEVLVEFVVTDSENLSATSTAVITFDQTPQSIVSPGGAVELPGGFTLNASSSIGATQYLWTKVSGPAGDVIADNESQETEVSFVLDGTYEYKLQVTSVCASDERIVTVEVISGGENLPPIASAGDDQCINEPVFDLEGMGSDPENEITGYLWNKISGPGVVVFDNAADPVTSLTFGESGIYVLELTITDDQGATASDQVEITFNVEPIGVAGDDQELLLSVTSATLDGSGSSDTEGDITYLWEQVSGPGVVIQNSMEPIAGFDFNGVGTYVFKLTVSDETCGQVFDEIAVVVTGDDGGGECNEVIYRVNAGGGLISDSPMDWSADTQNSTSAYFVQGNNNTTGWNYNDPNNATSAPNVIFGTNRRNASWGGDVKYEFPVTGSSYKVNLYFSEAPNSSISVGQRIFDISIENTTLLSNYDIVEATGDGTDVKTFNVNVVDGKLTIELIRKQNEAIISGIEIIDCSGGGGDNVPPIANAGADQSITLPVSSVSLDGSNSSDSDGQISSFSWSQVSGRTPGQFSGQNAAVLNLSDLVQGTYVFDLTVADDDGASNTDQVTLIVNPEAGENTAPIADAGNDQVITFPTNSLQLLGSNSSDLEGPIVSYLWSQLSGPNSATITNLADADPVISDLVEGTYLFSLLVADNEAATNSDQVEVQVIAGNTGDCESVLYRVNAGGGVISDWEGDTQASPTAYLNSNAQATTGWNYDNPENTTEAPNQIFGTFRYEATWTDEISYSFPVSASDVIEVRLYFAEKPFANTQVGDRIIGVRIEGAVVFDDLDIVQEVGSGGLMRSFTLQSSDGSIDIDIFKVLNDPQINGIELLSCGIPPAPRLVVEVKESLVVFPNPAEDELHLLISPIETESDFEVVLYDQAMRAVATYQKVLLPGQMEVVLDLQGSASLKPGMYFVKTKGVGPDQKNSQISRFIKK